MIFLLCRSSLREQIESHRAVFSDINENGLHLINGGAGGMAGGMGQGGVVVSGTTEPFLHGGNGQGTQSFNDAQIFLDDFVYAGYITPGVGGAGGVAIPPSAGGGDGGGGGGGGILIDGLGPPSEYAAVDGNSGNHGVAGMAGQGYGAGGGSGSFTGPSFTGYPSGDGASGVVVLSYCPNGRYFQSGQCHECLYGALSNTGVSALGEADTCNAEPMDADCVGSWLPCTNACEDAGKRVWIEMTAQSGNGAACPSPMACEPGVDACPPSSPPSPPPPRLQKITGGWASSQGPPLRFARRNTIDVGSGKVCRKQPPGTGLRYICD